jgi:hypothetical protein
VIVESCPTDERQVGTKTRTASQSASRQDRHPTITLGSTVQGRCFGSADAITFCCRDVHFPTMYLSIPPPRLCNSSHDQQQLMDGAGVRDEESARSAADPAPIGQDAYPNFAFLVHSQTSLLQDLPPKVDTAMTARQKRRRTRYACSLLHASFVRPATPRLKSY